MNQINQWTQLEDWFSSPANAISFNQVRNAIDQKTKPPGSLGQLEIVAAHLALLQDSLTPSLEKGRIIVFGADHGIANEGVSAYPSEVTAQMMGNFAGGGAAVCVLGAAAGVNIEAIDVGVNSDIGDMPDIVHAKVANGTSNFAQQAAMSQQQLNASLDVGRQAVQRAREANVDCVGLGEMGIANTSSASAIIAMLLNLPAMDVTGRGTGIDDDAVLHKTQVIQRAIELHQPECKNAMDILQRVGGFEIAAMTGAMLEAHEHQLPVLVDGFISTAAALVAVKHKPDVRSCLLFSHQSAERAHTTALDALDAYPLLNLNMRLGEGSATALAFPLLKAACAMLNQMSTFAQAGVSDKST